jgi:hypothetical protein
VLKPAACAMALAGLLMVSDRSDRTRIVYMLETDDAKHVAIARADGRGERLLTEGDAWHLYPTIDAPGAQVAWVEGPDARHLGVKVHDLDSGRTETWADATGMNLHPEFSGDGRTLAWSAPVGPDGKHRIAVLDLEKARAGGDRTPRIVPSEHPCFFPALSSDGHLLAFHRNVGARTREVVLVDLRTNQQKVISRPGESAMAPEMSFDDRHVAYVRQDGEKWDIVRADWRAGTATVVTDGEGRNHAPAFRPDGSILFASDRGGTFAIWEVAIADIEAGRTIARPVGSSDGGTRYAPASSGTLRTFVKQEMEPSLPDPPRSSFGAVFHEGRIYVAGGHKGKEHTYPPESFMPDLEIYDVASRTWKHAAKRALPCHGFQIVAHGGHIYAFGGFAYSKDHKPRWKSIDLIDRYDIARDRWETVGRLPRPRSSNVVGVVDGKAYLIGGWDATPQHDGDLEGRFHRAIDVFDLATGTCSVSPHPLPDPLRRALSGITVGDRILLVGGLGQGASHFELMDRVTAYQPATGKFEEWTPLPFPTFAPAVGMAEGQLMVFGGMFRTGPRAYDYVNHVFALPRPDGRWTHTGRYLRETKGFSQVLELAPGRLGVLGGHSYDVEGDDGPVSTFEMFLVPPGAE